MIKQNATVRFYLNETAVEVVNPDPDMVLIDYLKSAELNMSGPKKPCGQGGCGSCTVIMSEWDESSKSVVHESINSCLRPVTAVNGKVITTIEGTGSVAGTMNKVAYQVAVNNGTQCGYCTNGWVMAMTNMMAERDSAPGKPAPSKKEIEDLFDGNICRCTGYRSLLTGMKTFADDWSKQDEKERMKCVIDPAFNAHQVAKTVTLPFPDAAKKPSEPMNYAVDGRSWIAVSTTNEILELVEKTGVEQIRFVHGNTSFGIYKDEFPEVNHFIDIGSIGSLSGIEIKGSVLSVGSATTYSELIQFLEDTNPKLASVEQAILHMAKRTAGTIVRNAASVAGNTMLVLHHIHQGEPFPSDLLTALTALDAHVDWLDIISGEESNNSIAELIAYCVGDSEICQTSIDSELHCRTCQQ